MDPLPPSLAEALALDRNMLVAAGILVVAYALIFSDLLHRTSAAIIGAVLMVAIGMTMGFYSQEAALRAIDANTIFLLMGMMIVVAILRPSGAFEYVAIRLTKLSFGNPKLLMIYLGFAVSVISMVLDNVTTIIIFAPLTVLITRLLNVNPMPYLMMEAMLSNIGGIATLVGDPPNIMIGSAADIDFTSFLIHMGPPIAVIWVVATGLLLVLFRKNLTADDKGVQLDLDETQAIKDRRVLVRALACLGLVVLLFFVHHRLHIYPSYAAFIGLALGLALLQPRPEDLFGEVDWAVLAFFAGLFIIVGGVENSGLLDLVGLKLATMAEEPGQLLMTALVLMWVAALLSAVVDNIPFTVTMIPIVLGLDTQGVNITPLWWALAIGVGLGGNGSHVGATANLIAVAESEKSGMPEARITPLMWLRYGLPTMFASLLVASLLFAVFFDFFS